MTPAPGLICSLRELRLARKLSQLELARRAGISRQACSAIESGTSVPGTDVTLRLAAALAVRVESLFRLDQAPAPIGATLAGEARATSAGGPLRVVLAEVAGRWVAHAIDRDALSQAADGLARPGRPTATRSRTVRVEPLAGLAAARQRLLIMGCAPALGLLAARLDGEPTGVQVSWVHGPSSAALSALRKREVHIAGLHLLDERSGQYNAPVVRKQLPDRRMLLVNLLSWEQGIVVARGNPLGIRGAADLLGSKVRFAARETGAGAHKLLERALRKEGGWLADMRGRSVAVRGHMEVARAIALGAADAGVAIRSAAVAFGLDFIPLAEERFDLVIPRDLATDPRVERLVDVLGSRPFRRELESAGGYLVDASGQQVADTGPA